MAIVTVATILLMMCVASLAEHHEEYHTAHPKYEFDYGVKDPHTHDIKEQAEKRDGHKVEGHYKLVEPDGTIRTIHYNADEHTGFHAHVHRAGHATHPIHDKKKMEMKDVKETEESTWDKNVKKPEESTWDKDVKKPEESTWDKDVKKPEESTWDKKMKKPEKGMSDHKASSYSNSHLY